MNRGGRAVIGLDNDGDLTGLNLTLYEGEIDILQAPNGWGKTTLLEALSGLDLRSNGKLCLIGNNISSASSWVRRRLGLVYVPATRNVANSLKVKDQLSLARASSIPKSLKPLFDKNISALSGGQKQLLALSLNRHFMATRCCEVVG